MKEFLCIGKLSGAGKTIKDGKLAFEDLKKLRKHKKRKKE